MKPRPSTPHPANTPLSDTKISIHQLVSRLIASLQPSAVKRNNILLNDIPRELLVNADENTLAYVLSNLVNSAVSITENSCIHIEAILTDDHTMIRVKDQDTYIYHTMEISGYQA